MPNPIRPKITAHQFSIGPVQIEKWLIKNHEGEHVGRMPDGSLIVFGHRRDEFLWIHHGSFDELVEGGEIGNSLIREIAHALGITEYEGQLVDDLFRDLTDEDMAKWRA